MTAAAVTLAGLTDHEIGCLVLLYSYKVAPGPVIMSDAKLAELSAVWTRLEGRGLTVIDVRDSGPNYDLSDEGQKAIHAHLFGKAPSCAP